MPGAAWTSLQTVQDKKHGLYQHAACGRQAGPSHIAALKQPLCKNTRKPA